MVNTTIADYLPNFEQAVKRRRILLARCEDRGNIKYNASGLNITWRVQKDQRDLRVNNGAQTTSFEPKNLYDTAVVNYIGYVITDKMTKRERLMNKGTPAIIKVWEDVVESMFDDLEDRFAPELYIDDSAAGNTGRLSGIDSFTAATQTISVGTTTSTVARTANAADPVCYPSDTYAGISTILGNSAGTWSANWPFGVGDPVFDYFSPILINYSSTYFDGASTTWALNCNQATSMMLLYGKKNQASKGVMDLVLLTSEFYRQLAEKQRVNERVVINDPNKDRSYGQPRDYFMMDGAEITWEFGIPTNVGYGFNMSQFQIRSMQDKLFNADPIWFDQESRAYRLAVDYLGQMRYSPRYFGKLLTLA